ncbi:tRNA (guanosine(46)-N7)-methyltransferase TrmB [Alkaliphilus peptidifermentans]|uniref:tRNA (guanine-N(7)-)-methyltransferase n=1 Tax=Alkaliphilus peptidifermentans DSM 18978 TaxID=1120976 RepID=A0A1G5HSI9_9FIRM|nr:tRNA (guanosine(46)-N7)-methyltransferase TrmB [Alkaliphilus peptidifermentans]SCY66684.1 tRNA (guanine-N7-)-methyltransferase [Alkaliphilus peptidifermentans DSM 18978]
MRVRNIPGVEELLKNSSYFVNDHYNKINKWRSFFKNDNKIHIEIGMGKGKFLVTLAKNNTDINYIGIEKSKELLYKVAKEIEDSNLNNLCIINIKAEDIIEVFGPGEIDRIYLNFSDPWPKKRHGKRRLTHGDFLEKYWQILKQGGEIHFKTDSLDLFEFSLEEIRTSRFSVSNIYYDLHKEANISNVLTEYEEKFVNLGKTIYKYIAAKP